MFTDQVSDQQLNEIFNAFASTDRFQKSANAAIESSATDITSYFSFTLQIRPVDVLAALEQIGRKNKFQYYWEKPNEEFAFAAGECLERVQTTGYNRFKQASKLGKNLLGRIFHISQIKHTKAHVHLLGGFSFFDHNVHKDWRNFGAGSFTLPAWQIIKEGKLGLITVTVPIRESETFDSLVSSVNSKLEELQPVCDINQYKEVSKCKSSAAHIIEDKYSKKRWVENVTKAKQYISTGDFEKIVIARKLTVHTEGRISGTCILNQLRQQYPDCYSFLIQHDNSPAFIGSTPERLASFKQQILLTEGLAGSISRGKTASEDATLEHQLINSEKDKKEHAFVVDAIEKNLQPYAETVDHPRKPEVKKLSNVQHLFTPITAFLKDGISRTAVFEDLHPTPAVGGFPKEKAVPHIHELEDFDRGWYAAPVGWINASGEGEFAVAIRSGLIKEKEAHFFAGCGIVEASDPNKEWDETNLKFTPMLSALKFALK